METREQQMKEMLMNDLMRGIISPIIVAVLVGLGTSYFTHQIAFAKFEEKIAQHEREIQELKAETKGLAVLQERMVHLSNQLDRLERKLDHSNRTMQIAP
jgi:peptidoglycan hydrolase CwlO-like protein